MRNPLQRHYGRGDFHFVTFSCYRRRPNLGTRRARDHFVRILDELRCRHDFKLIGYVVMPEHVHLLMSEPKKSTPSKVLQVLKQKVSRALRAEGKKCVPGQLSLKFPREAAEPAAFWQRRFYDFNVYSRKKVREKLEYMHANPVQRKLVVHPREWPWSSWSYYATGEGMIQMDSVGGGEENEEKGKEKSKTAPLKPKGAAPKFISTR